MQASKCSTEMQALDKSDTKAVVEPIEFHKDLIEINKIPILKWAPSFNISNSEILELKLDPGSDLKLNPKLCPKCVRDTQLYICIEYVKDTILTKSPYYSICCFEHLFAFYDSSNSCISISTDTISIDSIKDPAELFNYNYSSIYLDGFYGDFGEDTKQVCKLLSSRAIHCNTLIIQNLYFRNYLNELIPCLLTLLHKETINKCIELQISVRELSRYIELFNRIGIKCQIPSYDVTASCDIYLYKDEIIISILIDDDREKNKFSYEYNSLLV